MTDTPTTIEVDDVHVHYEVYEDEAVGLKQLVSEGRLPRKAQRIHAVRGVSFAVHEGETIGIIGSNGSGKSTLLSAMTGLMPITSGDIRVRSRPALLGVSAALRASLSGRRNILIGCLALGMTPEETAHRTADIIDFAGLHDSIDLPMRTYSSGMKARLNFAIATAATPEILLIDEALAVGDADFRRRSQQRIDEIRERAGSVVLVSHNLDEIAKGCDRAVWLEKGELRMVGDSAGVVRAYTDAQAPTPVPSATTSRSRSIGAAAPADRITGRSAVLHLGISGADDGLVQESLHAGRSQIFRSGTIYPTFVGRQDHFDFVRYAAPPTAAVSDLDDHDSWVAFGEHFRDRFLRATEGDDDLVVSATGFSYLDAEAVDRLITLLRDAGFDDVDAVLFVRRQDEVASVVHRRQVLRGATEPFELAAAVDAAWRYDYAAIADMWAAALGSDRLHVRLHADRAELGSNLARFCDLAGLPALEPARRAETNAPASLGVVRELNRRRAGVPTTPNLDFLLRRLDGEEPPGLPRADAEHLLATYAEPNAAVLARVPESERIDDYFDCPLVDGAAERDFDRDDVLDLLELVTDHMGVLTRTINRMKKEM